MKKIYILAAAAIFSTAAIAQVPQAGKPYVKDSKQISVKHNNSKTPTDTLGWVPNLNWLPSEFALGGQVWNYGYTGGGYVYGNNVDSLDHCAQGYKNVGAVSFGVEGVLAGFVGKYHAGSGTTNITFNMYDMQPNSVYEWDGVNPVTLTGEGPSGAPLATTTMALNMADTTWFTLNYAAFPSVVSVSGTSFALSMDVTAFRASGDTIGLASDTDGEGYRYAYHYYNSLNNFIVTADAFGGLNNNLALFPVVDDNFIGIDDKDFLNGMQLSAFPNPVVDQTTISYNLEENMNKVKLIVYDVTGKEIYNVNYGAQAKGSYNVTLDASEFTTGNYFYSLIANGNRLTKRFVVTK